MTRRKTVSRLAVLLVVGTVLMTGLTGVAAAWGDDVDQDATVEQDQDSDQTNAAVVNTGDQVNYNEQTQFGVAANVNDGSGDVDQDATVKQEQDNDQTNSAGINTGSQTNVNYQYQEGWAINYND